MKRFARISLMTTALVVLAAIAVSATCGYGHGDRYISYSCSERVCNVQVVSCPWAGGSGGGYEHDDNCQIMQYYYYTTEKCTHDGCPHNTEAGSHLHKAEHTQSSLPTINNCPY